MIMKQNGSLNRCIIENHEGAKFECDECEKQIIQTQHLTLGCKKYTNPLPQISQT